MKFLFLDSFSPDVKIVSQTYKEKGKQNNKMVRQKVFLVDLFVNYW